MSPQGTDSQFVRLLRPVTVWLTVQRWDGRKAPESPHLRVTNTFFQKRQVWLFGIERVPAWSRRQNQRMGAGGGGWTESIFWQKHFSEVRTPQNADGFRNCGEHRPLKRRQRPLTRVHAVVCSQRWLISLRGKSGRVEGGWGRGAGGEGTWLQQQTSQLQPCSKQIYRNMPAFYWQTIAAIIRKRRRGHFTERLPTF